MPIARNDTGRPLFWRSLAQSLGRPGMAAYNSWNREMGINPDGRFTGSDALNMGQTLGTSLASGGLLSGRPYDFNSGEAMQGFLPEMPDFSNLFGGLFQRSPTGVNQFGPTLGGYGGQPQAPGEIPYPSFTDWGNLPEQGGPYPGANYDQIHQGPPENLAGPRPDRQFIDNPYGDRRSRGSAEILAARTYGEDGRSLDNENNRNLESMAEGLLGQTVSQRNAQQAQMARAAMDRMFGRSYK